MVVVVWKKSERARTHLMTVFTTATLDQINTKPSTRTKKTVIPIEAPFIELGVGKVFIDKWKKQYKIKKVNYWPPETKI